MTSFKTTIIASIRRKAFERTYYEETIANWMLHGWLTDEETIEIFKVLDEVFPNESDVVPKEK